MNITAFSVFESSAYQHSKKQLKKRFRLITLLQVIESNIYLIYIYDKSDLENITEKELDEMIRGLVGELK